MVAFDERIQPIAREYLSKNGGIRRPTGFYGGFNADTNDRPEDGWIIPEDVKVHEETEWEFAGTEADDQPHSIMTVVIPFDGDDPQAHDGWVEIAADLDFKSMMLMALGGEMRAELYGTWVDGEIRLELFLDPPIDPTENPAWNIAQTDVPDSMKLIQMVDIYCALDREKYANDDAQEFINYCAERMQ